MKKRRLYKRQTGDEESNENFTSFNDCVIKKFNINTSPLTAGQLSVRILGSGIILCMKPLSITIKTKAIKHHFRVLLFIILYKVVANFESVDEILKCDYSNESL